MTTLVPPPGPDRHRAIVSEVALLWAAHHPGPFPDVPFDDRHDLAYLDFNMAGCVMTYLRNGGVRGPGHVEVLRDCLPRRARRRGPPRRFYPRPRVLLPQLHCRIVAFDR
ncbi:hypothetical protein ABZW10_38160, partial [Kitasatospora sp. NPDC004723]|uniref:hypothetical protein n=1 Tax=Kitasatospora sp. NPDC004723 TaxID=3154288 RepID=UPI0033A8F6F3